MKLIKKIIVKLNLMNILSVLMYFFRIFKIKNNKIIFVNFSGKGFGDNLKYIYRELHLLEKDFDFVWLVDKNNMDYREFPSDIRLVKIFSVKSLYELSTAKIWINNSRFDLFVRKRKNQLYIQTWHGGLALKKIEYDAENKLSEYYRKVMKNDNKMIDIMLSNSTFCSNMYRNGFRYQGKILLCGSPRNDSLINNLETNNSKVRNFYKLNSKKIVLYAPTFRNNYDNNPYDIDFEMLVDELFKITGEQWTVVIKLHPRLQNTEIVEQFDKKWINATNYQDIQELICACDLLITDYSSTMFEAMIINKPVILYANDIEHYMDERGLYFKFDELPFALCKNNNELSLILKELGIKRITEKYSSFKNKIGLVEEGRASKIVSDYIMKCIDGGVNE